jgi:hypothetical protein
VEGSRHGRASPQLSCGVVGMNYLGCSISSWKQTLLARNICLASLASLAINPPLHSSFFDIICPDATCIKPFCQFGMLFHSLLPVRYWRPQTALGYYVRSLLRALHPIQLVLYFGHRAPDRWGKLYTFAAHWFIVWVTSKTLAHHFQVLDHEGADRLPFACRGFAYWVATTTFARRYWVLAGQARHYRALIGQGMIRHQTSPSRQR